MLPTEPKHDNGDRAPEIMIMGVGCTLYMDEGFGVRVIEKIKKWYTFPDNITVVDGGVLGVNLLGVMSQADHLIVVDIIRNQGRPGEVYRIDQEDIPKRIRAKNSLHQVDFLEAMTLLQALDRVPRTVIFGIEPENMETLEVGLTATAEKQVDKVIGLVLDEVMQLGFSYNKRTTPHVPSDTFQNYEN
jgi:hydrogenase maturation protease